MFNFPTKCLKVFLSKFEDKTDDFHIHRHVEFEFHVSRQVRDKYQFDDSLFALNGNVIFADFTAARVFANKINDKRDLVKYPEQMIKSGHINAMGLIDEILHYVVALYRQQVNPKTMEKALSWLNTNFSSEQVDLTLIKFVEEFPPVEVYKNRMDVSAYLAESTNGVANRQIALEEMLMLSLANMNPACSPYIELFDDTNLKKETAYSKILESLGHFFETQPRFGSENQNLIELLRTPAIRKPYSLEEQLIFIRQDWGMFMGDFLSRLLKGLGFIKEEDRAIFGGPPMTFVPEYSGVEEEPERFSTDLHWMPRLVLMAKSTLVWMDQLSKKYQRSIHKLDQIPDEELDVLARWGFTGLWLIGVWERCPSSKKIKQMCGNPEAESSAYSLFDYEISNDIGGNEALKNLRDRCWQRGIRLTSDMVPNHTGIDSKWVREHPDWFISLPYSPFPSYTFDGPNISGDQRYGVFIEDKYFTKTDAAVVFKRHDYWTGDVRYIYHGNDGTHMPWNDTAQLNFLNPEVREAVIQKILQVASMFPVIRFDAAMTLAKKHYQRLWFPEPGSGGDIPSRAEHGLTKADFHQQLANEFWREVVDRVAREAPDTLLLAEAFWLMEGYFVRSLGMHRVYNSAFMNMLKLEENEKYRNTIKNTIQFNPEILKRYVNFMNNPDEETALAQFGDGDKYFGVCIMMVTMPGLPMFGHGQIEGFSEKYGMEYRRAYWDEQVNSGLMQRHEREVFPLMKKRYLFAEVENFLLYDFFASEGHVNENVFAYSNRFGNERGLVLYHNKSENACGWIRTSSAFAVKTGNGSEIRLEQKTLGEGLALKNQDNYFCIFRDQISGLEYIRNCKEICENGLYVELGAYQHRVYLDFRQIEDNQWRHYAQLATNLNGRGVPSIDEELKELAYKPVLEAFDALFNVNMLQQFKANRLTTNNNKLDKTFLKEFDEKCLALFKQVKTCSTGEKDETELVKETRSKLKAILRLETIENEFPLPKSRKYQAAMKYLKSQATEEDMFWGTGYAWLIVHGLGEIMAESNYAEHSRSWLDDWLLGKRIRNLFFASGGNDAEVWQAHLLVNILTIQQDWFLDKKPKKGVEFRTLNNLFKSKELQQFLQVNRFEDILWFNKENFEKLVWWLFVTAVVKITAQQKTATNKVANEISDVFGIIPKWLKAEKASEYQVGKLLDLLKVGKSVVKKGKV